MTPPAVAADESFCWCHHTVEHIGPRTYRVCFECGHVWTRWALWRAFQREMWKLFRSDIPADPFQPTPRWRAVWWTVRGWFRRPSDIAFCQECLHDW